MTDLVYDKVHACLQELGLTTVDQIIDNYLESAGKEATVMNTLGYLLEAELKIRKASAESTRLKLAGFPAMKKLGSFDFSFQPSIDPAVVRDLAGLRFVHNNENVIFLGPSGVGKTHLAIALGIEAITAGFSVYFTSAAEMVSRLRQAQRKDALERELKNYGRPRVLIVDEIGYLPIEKEGAGALFRLVSRRYEHGSTIFTSNKPYSEWGEILGDPVIASATLDRILHHSTTVNIKGESFRLRSRKKVQGVGSEMKEVTATA
jgi:DNA replication protein DnaC